jgi:BirA family biotin operon repressor/biotin-[acetyl-CoA-carboxylase] ligase
VNASLEERLSALPLVRRVVLLEATGSTNDDARRLAAEGAPEGTVVIAGSQSAGRGRLGRAWHSPERSGLYLSVLLRPATPLDRAGRYALVAALAALEACLEAGALTARIKWPNDVLIGGRKAAGILAELRIAPAGPELVLGFGINVDEPAEGFPADLAGSAVALSRVAGHPVAVGDVAASLLSALDGWLRRLAEDRWDEVRAAFVRYAPGVDGARVSLRAGGTGITRGLDDGGALRVETIDGMVLVHAGESVASWEG